MAIMRWSPLFSRSLSQWPDFWDDDFLTGNSVNNSLDVFETENEVVVRANVAGIDEKNLDITFEKGVLWIKAEQEEKEEDQKRKYFSKSNWAYSYKVSVPGMLDHTQEPKVSLEQGMLTITFKKAEASKPKKLTVQSK